MVRSPELSDVTDRANCSAEMTERRRRRRRRRRTGAGIKQTVTYAKSGDGGREGGRAEKMEGGRHRVEAMVHRDSCHASNHQHVHLRLHRCCRMTTTDTVEKMLENQHNAGDIWQQVSVLIIIAPWACSGDQSPTRGAFGSVGEVLEAAWPRCAPSFPLHRVPGTACTTVMPSLTTRLPAQPTPCLNRAGGCRVMPNTHMQEGPRLHAPTYTRLGEADSCCGLKNEISCLLTGTHAAVWNYPGPSVPASIRWPRYNQGRGNSPRSPSLSACLPSWGMLGHLDDWAQREEPHPTSGRRLRQYGRDDSLVEKALRSSQSRKEKIHGHHDGGRQVML
ncbi:unnamed protein product [Pleuronectes platessa]|uniref:Uncharacterized protein n=1 Tax=Pleuronectes platessa TaxID=8262 RepID=A0A9N7UFZ3_PLEPL|nr:unnamed protein product [Pleuronectes platessa]